MTKFGRRSHQVDEVEPGQERGRQLDVFDHGQAGIVPALHRVGRRQDGRTSVEGADHSRLRNRHLVSFTAACIDQMGSCSAHVVVQSFRQLRNGRSVVGTTVL